MFSLHRLGKVNFSSLRKQKLDWYSTRIEKAVAINGGKQIQINFNDDSQYIFHASWMKDSAPNNIGHDFYRSKLYDVIDLHQYLIKNVNISDNGNSLNLLFHKTNGSDMDMEMENINIYPSQWLHSFAPFVASSQNKPIKTEHVNGTGSLFKNIYVNRKPWTKKNLKVPIFDAKDITSITGNYDKKIEFFERLVDPGFCVIENTAEINTNENECDEYDDNVVGEVLTQLVELSVGKLRMHHSRKNSHWVIRSKGAGAKQITDDYTQTNPIAMHTDHSFFNGSSAYLIFMHQFKADVMAKVCDGLAVGQYLADYYPNEFNLLTTINVTHSFRNVLYSNEGSLRSTLNEGNVREFETNQCHPIIQLDKENNIKRIVHSESKRGVCAIPFDIYDNYMNAYQLWCQLLSDDRFMVEVPFNEKNMIVINNWRLIHGRATIVDPENDRILVGAYVTREIFDNRYRYLQQLRMENNSDVFANFDKKSTTRMPNQVLNKLIQYK